MISTPKFLHQFFLSALILACSTPVIAEKILLLTTTERAGDAITINKNCVNEFERLRPTHSVVVLRGKLNNNAAPLTDLDLSPSSGPYDIVVTCSVYASINTEALQVISKGMRTRSARAFFNFDERVPFSAAFAGAKKDWNLVSNPPLRGGNEVPQILNKRSIYAEAFANLPILPGHSYSVFSGAPIDNTLYTPQTWPIPPDSTEVLAASTMVVPTEQSYIDENGTAQGACLFFSTDVSMFDERRYSQAAGRIAPTFINAAAAGGACSDSPSISKTFVPNGVNVGGTSVLTIQINNNSGYTDASGVFQPGAEISGLNIVDQLPPPLVLAAPPTTTCGGAFPTGEPGDSSLSLNNATLPATGCTITATVIWPISAVDACTGVTLTNTIASGTDFTTSAGAAQQDATAWIACPPIASIQVQKTTDSEYVLAGDTVAFTITVRNIGPADGQGIAIEDLLNEDWSGMAWNCSAEGGANCPTPSGIGPISSDGITIPASGVLTYSVTSTASGTQKVATNAVTVAAGTGLCTNGQPSCLASAAVAVIGGVNIEKELTSPALATIGDTATYTITLNNPTQQDISVPIQVIDRLPAGLTDGQWSCSGSACGSNISGAMPLDTTLENLPAQATVTFTLTATVDESAAGLTIVNTATAIPTAPALCLDGNNRCNATTQELRVRAATIAPVPMLSHWGMLLGIALLGGAAMLVRHSQTSGRDKTQPM